MIRAYLLLAAAVLFNVASYMIYRSLAGLAPRYGLPLFGVGLGFGAINAALFVRAIGVVPLSVAYPVFSAASYALIALLAAALFGERLQPVNLLGLVVVVVGIGLAAYSP